MLRSGEQHEKHWGYKFKSVGNNVLISDKAIFYSPEHISIGDNSRIDDWVILSAGEAGIQIGRYVHVACGVTIIGKGKVTLSDYSAISGKSSVYSSSDPYDGSLMTNPTIPEPFRQTYHKDVFLGKHVVVGANSVILPGTYLADGCAAGAMTLLQGEWPPLTLLVGIPCRKVKDRKDNIFELEKLLNEKENDLTK